MVEPKNTGCRPVHKAPDDLQQPLLQVRNMHTLDESSRDGPSTVGVNYMFHGNSRPRLELGSRDAYRRPEVLL